MSAVKILQIVMEVCVKIWRRPNAEIHFLPAPVLRGLKYSQKMVIMVSEWSWSTERMRQKNLAKCEQLGRVVFELLVPTLGPFATAQFWHLWVRSSSCPEMRSHFSAIHTTLYKPVMVLYFQKLWPVILPVNGVSHCLSAHKVSNTDINPKILYENLIKFDLTLF